MMRLEPKPDKVTNHLTEEHTNQLLNDTLSKVFSHLHFDVTDSDLQNTVICWMTTSKISPSPRQKSLVRVKATFIDSGSELNLILAKVVKQLGDEGASR
jgi:hypothetical protein